MPPFNLPGFNGLTNQADIINELAKLNKTLTWLLSNMDHINVRRLFTELCNIQSEAGETVIQGPLILMYDKQATPVLRLKMGYDLTTGNFVFNLYDKTGTKTVGVDSNGQATFTGTITGGTLQTALPGNARITITGGGFAGYTSDGLLSGLVFTPTPTDIVDLAFYHRGTKLLEFYDEFNRYIIRAASTAVNLGIGGNKPTYAYGDWIFSGADSITGLKTGPVPDHTHDVTTDTGTFTTTSSGGHSHGVIIG